MDKKTGFTIPEYFFEENVLTGLQTTSHFTFFQMHSLLKTNLHARIESVVIPSFRQAYHYCRV